MREHVDTYLDRSKGHVAKGTRDSQRGVLTRLADWWDQTRKVPMSLREQDVETYVWGPHDCGPQCRHPKHYGAGVRATCADTTINRVLGQLHAFFEWGVRFGHLRPEVLEPVTGRRRVRPRRARRRRLDADQLTTLVQECPDPWERMVCALAIYTAGRAGELRTLRIGDVDLDAGEIRWVRHKLRQDDDYMPITTELADELARWFEGYEKACGPLCDDWYLVPRRRTNGWGDTRIMRYYPDQFRQRGLWRTVKKNLARTLDLPEEDLTYEGVHTVRRSMARALYERLRSDGHADPISVVQALLGHANRAMTERYIGFESGRQERDRVLRGRSMLGKDT